MYVKKRMTEVPEVYAGVLVNERQSKEVTEPSEDRTELTGGGVITVFPTVKSYRDEEFFVQETERFNTEGMCYQLLFGRGASV